MIRRGRLSDKERAVELLRDSRVGAEFDKSDGASGFCFPFVPEYAERLFLSYIGCADRCCLVFEADGAAQGVLMAHAYEHPFGPVKMAQERLWWIDPAYRGRAAVEMLEAYEEWAASEGCEFIGMAGMGDDPRISAFYRRRGYVAAERNFLKAA